MTVEKLEELLQAGEGFTIEYKECVNGLNNSDRRRKTGDRTFTKRFQIHNNYAGENAWDKQKNSI